MITLDQDRFVEVIRKLLAKTYYRYVRMASEKRQCSSRLMKIVASFQRT